MPEPVTAAVEIARPRQEVFDCVESGPEWLNMPRSERILPVLSRAFVRRADGKGRKRPAALLEAG